MIKDPVRGTVAFETTAGVKYSAEELVAMQFALAKKQAEETAGESIKDVVITVSQLITSNGSMPFCSRQNAQV